NAQPMGFYAPAQIVRDARQHGVEIRPVDVNASRWDCTPEAVDGSKYHAVRLGLRLVKGLANKDGAALVAARGDRAYRSIEELQRRSDVPAAALERFAAAARAEEILPELTEPAVALRPMTTGREVVEDYGAVGFTLRRHPVAFLRADLAAQKIASCAQAIETRDGRWTMTAGLVLVRQRPGSASGVIFVTIEDETGIANLVVWPKIFERFRRIVLSARMIAVKGRIQREGEVVHLVAQELRDLSELLRSVGNREEEFPLPHGRGDQVTHGGGPDSREMPGRKPRDIFIPDLRL